MAPVPQGERLARIETLLETVDRRLLAIDQHLKRLEAAQIADAAELDKLKNRGAGILIGVSVVFTSIGVVIDKLLGKVFG